jgi:hypothetical protein
MYRGAEVTIVRTALLISALAALSFTGMVAPGATRPKSPEPALTESETVMATFHVVPGKEAYFEHLLVREWDVYTKGKLVLDQPDVVVRGKEADGKTYFVHIFTWVDHATPGHPPASVRAVWKSMVPLVEARHGHPNMEVTAVQLVVPKN